MGEQFISFYKNKITKEQKLAFYSTFIMILLVHAYKFSNTLLNHDSLYNYYSNQNILGSGRWGLSLACGISSYYDLPWINGLFSCLWLALAVVVIVKLFKMKNPVLILLAGGLLATAPALTETFYFLFTADGYMLGLLLSVLAVYFSRIDENRLIYSIFSTACICISCAIYQAYVPFALVLSVCYFMYELLENSYEKKDYYRWVVRQIFVFTIALAMYYIIWQLLMKVTGTSVSQYQGISEIGKVDITIIFTGLIKSIKDVLLYFTQWNVFKNGFSTYSIFNIIFIFFFVFGIIYAIVKSNIYKRGWAIVLFILCLLAIIPFACIWNFTSPSVIYRPMMLMCLTILFIFVALLYEKWSKSYEKNLLCVLLIGIVINGAIMANICYFYMEMCQQRTYADGIEMMTNIHEIQSESKFKKFVVIGDRRDNIFWTSEKEESITPKSVHMLLPLIERDLMFDGDHVKLYLAGTFDFKMPSISTSEFEDLKVLDEVKKMPRWPEKGSMQVIDDTLILKLGNEKEGE